jgi:hypothetical protein
MLFSQYMVAALVFVQAGSLPVPIQSGRAVQGSAANPGEDGIVGCYAISSAPGERIVAAIQPAGFEGEIRIARGALCNASALQARQSWVRAAATEAGLNAAGGRYLVVVVRTGGGGGTYRLTVTRQAGAAQVAAAPQAPAVPAGRGASAAAEPAGDPANAPPAQPAMSARRQLMMAQIEQRRVQQEIEAAERAARQAEAAEAQREAEERAAIYRAEEEERVAAARRSQEQGEAYLARSLAQTATNFGRAVAQIENERRQNEEYAAAEQIRINERSRARQEEAAAERDRARASNEAQRAAAQERLAEAQRRVREAQRAQVAAASPAARGAAGAAGGGASGGSSGGSAAGAQGGTQGGGGGPPGFYHERAVFCVDAEDSNTGAAYRACSINGDPYTYSPTPRRWQRDEQFLETVRGNCAGRPLRRGTSASDVQLNVRVYACGNPSSRRSLDEATARARGNNGLGPYPELRVFTEGPR